LAIVCNGLAVPRVAHDRRERVPFAREDLEYLGELRFDDQPPLVVRAAVAGARVADFKDQTLAAGQARGDAPFGEPLVKLCEQRLNMVPG
jgi:hypothetical protein